jgi:hypothetical protein
MDSPQPQQLERVRSLAQIIAEALDMYQDFPLVFLTLALGVIAPYELIVLAATGQGPLANGAHQNVGISYLVLLLDTILVGPLISALHIHAVVAIGEGSRPRIRTVAVSALKVLPVVVAAVIVSAFGIALGFLALIVPGIILALRWAVVAQVAAIDNEGWLPSLQRSHALTRGQYGHIFGLLIVTGLMAAGLNVAAAAIPLGSAAGVVSVAVGIATRTVTASFSALTLALLYFDLRARLAGGRPASGSPGEPNT